MDTIPVVKNVDTSCMKYERWENLLESGTTNSLFRFDLCIRMKNREQISKGGLLIATS